MLLPSSLYFSGIFFVVSSKTQVKLLLSASSYKYIDIENKSDCADSDSKEKISVESTVYSYTYRGSTRNIGNNEMSCKFAS